VIITLVLVSAFLHASWNALLRLEVDKDRSLVLAISFAALLACIVAAIRWQLGQEPFPTTASLVWTVLAGVLEWIYFWSLAKALERGRLGVVYTISRGGAILVVYPVSIALFSEQLTLVSGIGSAVVLGGLTLASTGTGDNRASHRNAVAWAVACAVAIAAYHLAYKAALREHGGPSAVFGVSLAAASLINVIRVGGAGREVIAQLARTRLARIVLMGALCGGSFLILMEGLVRGGAGFVLTLRNTSVLFAVGLAFLIGERPRRPEIIGAAFVAIGAILMAWPA
jgi:drug/metabolite transporter (DMT)-like permease